MSQNGGRLSSASKRKSSIAVKPWTCSVCTFLNEKQSQQCEMCLTMKGTSSRSPRLSEGFLGPVQSPFSSSTAVKRKMKSVKTTPTKPKEADGNRAMALKRNRKFTMSSVRTVGPKSSTVEKDPKSEHSVPAEHQIGQQTGHQHQVDGMPSKTTITRDVNPNSNAINITVGGITITITEEKDPTIQMPASKMNGSQERADNINAGEAKVPLIRSNRPGQASLGNNSERSQQPASNVRRRNSRRGSIADKLVGAACDNNNHARLA